MGEQILGIFNNKRFMSHQPFTTSCTEVERWLIENEAVFPVLFHALEKNRRITFTETYIFFQQKIISKNKTNNDHFFTPSMFYGSNYVAFTFLFLSET